MNDLQERLNFWNEKLKDEKFIGFLDENFTGEPLQLFLSDDKSRTGIFFCGRYHSNIENLFTGLGSHYWEMERLQEQLSFWNEKIKDNRLTVIHTSDTNKKTVITKELGLFFSTLTISWGAYPFQSQGLVDKAVFFFGGLSYHYNQEIGDFLMWFYNNFSPTLAQVIPAMDKEALAINYGKPIPDF